jgi:two-component system, NarL family, nitrate/nitrite response regulator NarL
MTLFYFKFSSMIIDNMHPRKSAIRKDPIRNATVLLVGPNKLSRASLRSLFDGSQFTVIGEVANIATPSDASNRDALPALIAVPDVVLVEMPEATEGILDVLARAEAVYPGTPAVVLHDTVCIATLVACFGAGAGGFLTRDITRDALLNFLELAVLGERVFPTQLAKLLSEGVGQRRTPTLRANAFDLSVREIEILQCLLRGESNKVIANRLDLAEATVKVHMKSVLRKIKVTNRTQAAIWAHSRGYVAPDDSLLLEAAQAL